MRRDFAGGMMVVKENPKYKEVTPMSIFPTKILLATDGSEEARLAAQAAAELSKGTGSEVHVAYVLPSPTELRGHHLYSQEVMRSVLEQAEEEANSFLEEQAEQVRESGGKVAETHLRAGRPDKEIVRLSEDLDVGTIVVGSRGLGAISRTLMGSVSESVIRHAHCPVFVVRE
jgi:nucleotide-binding universal stress UspA family protein